MSISGELLNKRVALLNKLPGRQQAVVGSIWRIKEKKRKRNLEEEEAFSKKIGYDFLFSKHVNFLKVVEVGIARYFQQGQWLKEEDGDVSVAGNNFLNDYDRIDSEDMEDIIISGNSRTCLFLKLKSDTLEEAEISVLKKIMDLHDSDVLPNVVWNTNLFNGGKELIFLTSSVNLHEAPPIPSDDEKDPSIYTLVNIVEGE